MLPGGLAELCENVRDFLVVEDGAGEIIACGALHLYGRHLTEVRSIAVDPAAQGNGASELLVRALLAEAEWQRVRCVCLFTRIPRFFARFGFQIANKESLPDKISKDCQRCSRQFVCDETGMVRGELPPVAIPAPQRSVALSDLVQLRAGAFSG